MVAYSETKRLKDRHYSSTKEYSSTLAKLNGVLSNKSDINRKLEKYVHRFTNQ